MEVGGGDLHEMLGEEEDLLMDFLGRIVEVKEGGRVSTKASMYWKHEAQRPWLRLTVGAASDVVMSSKLIHCPSSSLLTRMEQEGAEFFREGRSTRLHWVQTVNTSWLL